MFVTSAPLDSAGADYVRTATEGGTPLEVFDGPELGQAALRTQTLAVPEDEIALPLASNVINESLGDEAKILVALIAATELVRLPGIEDLSIFELNVRLGLGKTRINKQLSSTIQEQTEHSLFPAYHNGLTLLTRSVDISEAGSELGLRGVSVVNGCQSLLALYNNRRHLTPSLKVLVKIVQLDRTGRLVSAIT